MLVMRSTKRKYFGAGKMVAKTKSKNLYIADKKKSDFKKRKRNLNKHNIYNTSNFNQHNINDMTTRKANCPGALWEITTRLASELLKKVTYHPMFYFSRVIHR